MPRVTITATVTRTITIPDEFNATGLANNFAGMLDQHADTLEADGWWAPGVTVEHGEDATRGRSFTVRETDDEEPSTSPPDSR
jgi:hypothetical protein